MLWGVGRAESGGALDDHGSTRRWGTADRQAVRSWAQTVVLAAALGGSLIAVRRAVSLPPAEAMRPPTPPSYRHAVSTIRLFLRALDQPTRIILRQTLRRPLRAATTLLGLSLAIGLLVSSLQWLDSIDRIVETAFVDAQHQDMTVAFLEAEGRGILGMHEEGTLAVLLPPVRVPEDRVRRERAPLAGREEQREVLGRDGRSPLFRAKTLSRRTGQRPP